MKRTLIGLTLALCVGLLPNGADAAAPPAVPKPAQCPATPPMASDTNARKGPLTIPPGLAAIARSSRISLAVLTLTGSNFCQDIHTISEAHDFALSTDSRFFSFGWYGFEEGGYIVIDRSGRGQSVDTGAKPVFSPSRRQMAAIEFSESGFGSLNGFAIWQVNPVGLRRTVMIAEIPSLVDWRIDGWAGETCIKLSGIPISRIVDATQDYARLARDRYVARPAGPSWRITRASGRGCRAG